MTGIGIAWIILCVAFVIGSINMALMFRNGEMEKWNFYTHQSASVTILVSFAYLIYSYLDMIINR